MLLPGASGRDREATPGRRRRRGRGGAPAARGGRSRAALGGRGGDLSAPGAAATPVRGGGAGLPGLRPRGGLGQRSHLRLIAAALALAALLPACTDTRGIVQIAWAFVDRGGNPIFPGPLTDTCRFRGELAGEDREFDLQIAVRACDPACAGGCDDDDCLITEPLVYSCLGARGSSEIPSSEAPYAFKVEVLAEFDDACACAIEAPCAEVPGPRLRMVRQGLITDLQVYQLVLDMPDPSRASLALDGCCTPPPGCP